MMRVVIIATLCLIAASTQALDAGVAKAAITPERVEGRIGVMGEPLKGVNHDLFARALVLNDGEKRLVLVTYDLNCLDVATPLLRKRLRDELGIGPECFIPMATHNHAAPIQIVPDNFDYGRWLADRIFQLVQEAIANERGPVTVSFGSGAWYWVKTMGNAPADFEVQALRVSQGDAPMAVFFNHPCHPMQISETVVGVGHPGYAVDAIEEAVPGTMAMYTDACGGNQFTYQGMSGTREQVEAAGRELAGIVVGILGGPMRDVTGPLRSVLKTVPLPLARPMSKEAALNLAKHYPSDIGLVPYPHEDRESNWVRNLVRYYHEGLPFPARTTDMTCTDNAFLVEKLPEPREFECRYEEAIVAKIGDLLLVSMQGEVCAPIGMRIKDQFRYEHPIMVSAYMGEHNLYIPTRELVRMNLYQAQVIQTQYASPVGWSPSVEDDMVGAVVSAVREVVRGK